MKLPLTGFSGADKALHPKRNIFAGHFFKVTVTASVGNVPFV